MKKKKVLKMPKAGQAGNGTKPHVSDSKKMLCTKTLIHLSGSKDFTAGEKYTIVKKITGGVVLKDNGGYEHTITKDGWLAFFNYC